MHIIHSAADDTTYIYTYPRWERCTSLVFFGYGGLWYGALRRVRLNICALTLP